MECRSVTRRAPASREVESHGGSVCASAARPIGFSAAVALRLFPCDGRCQTLTVRWWRNQLHSPASPHLLRAPSFRLPRKAFRPCALLPGFLPSSRRHRRHRTSASAPNRSFLPPSGFLSLSTAYSAFGSAGLFHPAATSRVACPGASPSAQPPSLVGKRFPRVV